MVVWSFYLVVVDQVKVIGQEVDHDPHKDYAQDVGYNADNKLGHVREILVLELGANQNEWVNATQNPKDAYPESVDNQQHEGFAVLEAHAVAQPRTVVVHYQHTTLAGRAVVSALGLKNLANQAVSGVSEESIKLSNEKQIRISRETLEMLARSDKKQ